MKLEMLWLAALAAQLLVVACPADDVEEYVAQFRRSCWRESVMVDGKTVSVTQAVPVWLQTLASVSNNARLLASQNLSRAAIAGQLKYSTDLADRIGKAYLAEPLTNGVSLDVKICLLATLSEIGDPKLKELLSGEKHRHERELGQIVSLIETKGYLFPAFSGQMDLQEFLRQKKASTNSITQASEIELGK